MSRPSHHYHFPEPIEFEDVESSLLLSLFAAESVHGEAALKLGVHYELDRQARSLVISVDTPAGLDLDRILRGFLTREFRPGEYACRRVGGEATGRPSARDCDRASGQSPTPAAV